MLPFKMFTKNKWCYTVTLFPPQSSGDASDMYSGSSSVESLSGNQFWIQESTKDVLLQTYELNSRRIFLYTVFSRRKDHLYVYADWGRQLHWHCWVAGWSNSIGRRLCSLHQNKLLVRSMVLREIHTDWIHIQRPQVHGMKVTRENVPSCLMDKVLRASAK